MHTSRLVTSIAVVQVLAIALWVGGLIALGAVVAPIVFRVVPAPTSADAMTLVFGRFDRVSIACAAVALVAEAAFAAATRTRERGKATRVDLVRAAALTIAAALAIVIGAWLSPGIAELHHAGAVRGLGEAGLALEKMHRLAESLAKLELALLVVVIALAIVKVARGTNA
jgi:hypothetical protein